MSLTEAHARSLLRKFRNRRILVIGDLMLDRYVYGSVDRISPEAPVPVVRVREERNMPGGACNVAANIRALGGRCGLCGWFGRDAAGRELRRLLTAQGVDLGGVIESGAVQTTTKTRVIAERQQVVRVDAESHAADVSSRVVRQLLNRVRREVALSDGVIIEDYGKGVVSQQVADTAIREAAKRGIPIGLDPKDDHEISAQGITFATPNRKEAFGCAGMPDPGAAADPLRDRALLEAGRRLQDRWQPRHLLITLGPSGMLLLSADGTSHHVPTRAREVFDVSGAGDTVIAVAALAVASGASGVLAAEFSNMAAGVVVGKLGTATCSPDELMAFMRNDSGSDS